MRLKILHVINTLDPRAGGPVSVLLPMAKRQAAMGHHVTICSTVTPVTLDFLGISFKERRFSDGVQFVSFISNSSILFSLSLKKWLDLNVAEHDVLHIHTLYRFPVSYAAYCARRKNVPYIMCPHGALDPFLYKQSAHSLFLKRFYELFVDLPNLNKASFIQYTSQEEMERAAFLKLTAPTCIFPNGLDLSDFEKLPIKGKFRQRLSLSHKAPLVLFLGRLNFKKGLDFLIPSFSKLLEHVPNAHLAIVGPDNEGYGSKVRQWCREYAVEHQINFVNHLPPEEVKEAYMDADVFALTSYTENFGMTVAEAMACECPVVISDQVNIWREVRDAGAGIVVPLDKDQITCALRLVLEDYEQARSMGQAGRELVREKYDWDKINVELIETYSDLIEG